MGKSVAVLTTAKVGISTTIIGQQVMDGLRALGWEVVPIFIDETKSFGKVQGLPVLSLAEDVTVDLMNSVRFVHPTKLVSVLMANWGEHTTPYKLAYLSLFFDKSFGGVPVHHVSHSEHTAEEVLKTAKRYLSPTVVRQMCSQLHTVLYGVDDGFVPGVNDPDDLIVPYNRVNQQFKNVKLHAEVTRSYQNWAGVNGYSPTSTYYYAPGFGPDSKDFEYDSGVYTFIPQFSNRTDFKDRLSHSGMFLSTSVSESFGLYYLELLMSGSIGVFMDRPWIRSLIPDYPFIVSSAELVDCMIHVRKDFDTHRRTMSEFRKVLYTRFALSRFVSQISDLLSK